MKGFSFSMGGESGLLRRLETDLARLAPSSSIRLWTAPLRLLTDLALLAQLPD